MSAKTSINRDDALSKDSINDALELAKHKRTNKQTGKIVAFGSLPVGNDYMFSIPGSFADKQFYKASSAYAREVTTKDYVPMTSGDDVELIA